MSPDAIRLAISTARAASLFIIVPVFALNKQRVECCPFGHGMEFYPASPNPQGVNVKNSHFRFCHKCLYCNSLHKP